MLFDFEKQYKSETSNLKYKFTPKHEEKLSKWMKGNFIMQFVSIDDPMEFEIYMIKTYEPPLNLKDNYSEKNRAFSEALSHLRTTR